MTIEEILEAGLIVQEALETEDDIDVLSLSDEANRAAWILAKAWLAEKCGAELVVAVREDDGTIE